MRRFVRISQWLAFIVLLLACLWGVAALYFDFPVSGLRVPTAASFGILLFAVAVLVPDRRKRALGWLTGFLVVLAWWLTIPPSNDRDWQLDVDRTAWAEIDDNRVTIHNVRNFDYRTETDYTPRWETRSYDLGDIRGADLFVTFWGSEWIAHPILSFQFGEDEHIAFSVETRKEVGEDYSAVRGFFRQYELIYIIGDERDLVRLRTNYRVGEEVYVYRTTMSPEAARAIFLDYLISVNDLHDRPAFYNAITSNCTTNIRVHTLSAAGEHAAPWSWRLLLNGKGDEYAYDHGRLAGDMPFEDLKRQAHINDAARSADQSPEFSQQIRENRAGFAQR